jgi:hypothetical protein
MGMSRDPALRSLESNPKQRHALGAIACGIGIALLHACSTVPQPAPRVEQQPPAYLDRPQNAPLEHPRSTYEPPVATDEQPAVQDRPSDREAVVQKAPPRCDSDEVHTSWLGSPPSPDWWRAFAQSRPNRTSVNVYHPGVRAPLIRIQVFDSESVPQVLRHYRQNFGRYRMCYEEALPKDPHLEGHWVVRVTLAPGQVCAVEVIDTRLPEALSTCLREALLLQNTLDEAGRLELALTFHPERRMR